MVHTHQGVYQPWWVHTLVGIYTTLGTPWVHPAPSHAPGPRIPRALMAREGFLLAGLLARGPRSRRSSREGGPGCPPGKAGRPPYMVGGHPASFPPPLYMPPCTPPGTPASLSTPQRAQSPLRARGRAGDGALGSVLRNALGGRIFSRPEQEKCLASYASRARVIPRARVRLDKDWIANGGSLGSGPRKRHPAQKRASGPRAQDPSRARTRARRGRSP